VVPLLEEATEDLEVEEEEVVPLLDQTLDGEMEFSPMLRDYQELLVTDFRAELTLMYLLIRAEVVEVQELLVATAVQVVLPPAEQDDQVQLQGFLYYMPEVVAAEVAV
jgi:hypothetical protein